MTCLRTVHDARAPRHLWRNRNQRQQCASDRAVVVVVVGQECGEGLPDQFPRSMSRCRAAPVPVRVCACARCIWWWWVVAVLVVALGGGRGGWLGSLLPAIISSSVCATIDHTG